MAKSGGEGQGNLAVFVAPKSCARLRNQITGGTWPPNLATNQKYMEKFIGEDGKEMVYVSLPVDVARQAYEDLARSSQFPAVNALIAALRDV